MATLPTPGTTTSWGDDLNTWLQVEHSSTGLHDDAGSMVEDMVCHNLETVLCRTNKVGIRPSGSEIVTIH